MKRIIGLTLLALVLIGVCLEAAQWQFHRYEARHERNREILANVEKLTDESQLATAVNLSFVAWKQIKIRGHFDPTHEILVRNRYNNDVYGYGVVTIFVSDSGKRYWVDRGWVKAGKDALTPPITQKVTSEETQILGRVRVEKIEEQIGGTIFASPTKSGVGILERWNGSAAIQTEPYYFDLISSDRPEFTPLVPTPLPEITDGPHLAYTFQWVIFALLIACGWFLVIREDRKVQAEKA